MLKELYTDNINLVRINGAYSSPFSSENGVRQGDNQSSMLFNCHINDLLKTLRESDLGIEVNNIKINCLAYADDLVLIADSPKMLNGLLQLLQKWCSEWMVVINTDKTKIVHFRKLNRPISRVQYKIGNSVIEIVPNYKYLGVIMN